MPLSSITALLHWTARAALSEQAGSGGRVWYRAQPHRGAPVRPAGRHNNQEPVTGLPSRHAGHTTAGRHHQPAINLLITFSTNINLLKFCYRILRTDQTVQQRNLNPTRDIVAMPRYCWGGDGGGGYRWPQPAPLCCPPGQNSLQQLNIVKSCRPRNTALDPAHPGGGGGGERWTGQRPRPGEIAVMEGSFPVITRRHSAPQQRGTLQRICPLSNTWKH